jgi:hypothetical protein
MKNARVVGEAGSNWQAQIDGDTWEELTRLLDRVADTLGTIAPVLDLAKNKTEKEKLRHFRAVTDLASRGHRALKAFSQRWAMVLEESRNSRETMDLEDFSDIYVCAKAVWEIGGDEPPSHSSSGKAPAAYAPCEAAPKAPPPSSDSVIAEVPHVLR